MANQAEDPAFLPQSMLAFVLSQQEEFTACYGSTAPAVEEKDLLQTGNPFCLTHSHPDGNAKEERRYQECS